MDLRDKILGADDLSRRPVACPEWDCTLYVRALTAGEAEALGREMNDGDEGYVMARMLVRVVTDENGDSVFKPEDAEALAGKNGNAVRRLFEASQVESGMTKESYAELEGNSNGAPGDDSSSVLRSA